VKLNCIKHVRSLLNKFTSTCCHGCTNLNEVVRRETSVKTDIILVNKRMATLLEMDMFRTARVYFSFF
jgi:hypothetical protein